MNAPQNKTPNCLQCRHYATTWDARQPRSCKLYGFKTSLLPSVSVVRETGIACLGFAPKLPTKPAR